MIAHPRPLIEVFAAMSDFRKPRGTRHPLTAIFALACCAMLCGARSYSAIAAWGRNYDARITQAFGFTHAPPCYGDDLLAAASRSDTGAGGLTPWSRRPQATYAQGKQTSSQQRCKPPCVTLERDGTREDQMPARGQFLPSWLVWA
jgi:hypothetical protein